jgi:hypothetical protein
MSDSPERIADATRHRPPNTDSDRPADSKCHPSSGADLSRIRWSRTAPLGVRGLVSVCLQGPTYGRPAHSSARPAFGLRAAGAPTTRPAQEPTKTQIRPGHHGGAAAAGKPRSGCRGHARNASTRRAGWRRAAPLRPSRVEVGVGCSVSVHCDPPPRGRSKSERCVPPSPTGRHGPGRCGPRRRRLARWRRWTRHGRAYRACGARRAAGGPRRWSLPGGGRDDGEGFLPRDARRQGGGQHQQGLGAQFDRKGVDEAEGVLLRPRVELVLALEVAGGDRGREPGPLGELVAGGLGAVPHRGGRSDVGVGWVQQLAGRRGRGVDVASEDVGQLVSGRPVAGGTAQGQQQSGPQRRCHVVPGPDPGVEPCCVPVQRTCHVGHALPPSIASRLTMPVRCTSTPPGTRVCRSQTAPDCERQAAGSPS